MPNYSKMYNLMVSAASEALDVLPDTEENETGRNILQTALYAAEEMYVADNGDKPEL